MQTSQAVLNIAGGNYSASLNHYLAAGEMVTTLQLDDWVYVVGPDDFAVMRYSLDQWRDREGRGLEPQVLECDDARQSWELLSILREDALLWQCGACDGWIFTSNRPRVGVLPCSTCGDGGVDFRHADRHVGHE